MTKEAVDELWW